MFGKSQENEIVEIKTESLNTFFWIVALKNEKIPVN